MKTTKNSKRFLLLWVLMVNLLPSIKDGQVTWTTMRVEAQQYIVEGMVDGLYKCVNTLDENDWFPSSTTSCLYVQICACKYCRAEWDCDGPCPNQLCPSNDETQADPCICCGQPKDYKNQCVNTSCYCSPFYDPPEPPSGGGGGSLPVVAPIAKQLFRNQNMTDINWNRIERMLEKILENCLGAALYNSLVSYLNGSTLPIQFGNTSSFNYSNGMITIENGESSRLFHEMWHAYQAYQETQATFNASELNQEFESWYAQYLYLSNLPEYKITGSKWSKWYTDSDIGKAVRGISKHVNRNGTLKTSEMQWTNYMYSSLIPGFSAGGYPEGADYTLDVNRSAVYDFRNLNVLSFNCN
jgi:hypothetical protein